MQRNFNSTYKVRAVRDDQLYAVYTFLALVK